MIKEDKELLLKDLCARLPYHPILHFDDKVQQDDEYLYGFRENGGKFLINDAYYVEEVKPYLRPMSSMIEEEEVYYNLIYPHLNFWQKTDWLNSHLFDYRGLIPQGLAIEAPKDMYKID